MQIVEQAFNELGLDIKDNGPVFEFVLTVLELVNAFPESQRADLLASVAAELRGPDEGRTARVVALLTPAGGAA